MATIDKEHFIRTDRPLPLRALARLAAALWTAAAAPPVARAATLVVTDYPSVQAALDAARDGDRLHFTSPVAADSFYQAPAGGWVIDKSLEIFGDGVGRMDDYSGTTFVPRSDDDHVFVIKAPVFDVYLHDFKIRAGRSPAGRGRGNGIHCVTTPGAKAAEITVERVTVLGLAGNGFHFEGADHDTSAIVQLRIRDAKAVACRGDGFRIVNSSATYLLGANASGNHGFGFYCEASGGIRLMACVAEGNQLDGTNPAFDAQLRLKGCHAFTVLGGHFERFDSGVAGTAITVEFCLGGSITTSLFVNPAGHRGSRGIFIVGGSQGISIGPNMWNFVDTLIEVHPDDGNRECIVQPQVVQHSNAQTRNAIKLPEGGGHLRLAAPDSGGPTR